MGKPLVIRCTVLVVWTVGLGTLGAWALRPSDDPPLKSYLLYMEARWAELQGHVDRAEALYKQAIAVAEHPGVIYYDLGLLYRRMRRWKQAVEALERAVDHEPLLSEAWRHLGELAEFLASAESDVRWKDRAIVAYQRFLEMEPDGTVAAQMLSLLVERGRREEALQWGEQLLSRTTWHRADLCLALFEIYSRMQRWSDAERTITCYVTLRPEDPWGHHRRGWVLLQRQQLDEAVTSFQQALSLAPNDLDLLRVTVRTLRRHRAFSQAEALVDGFLERQPRSIEAWLLKVEIRADAQGPSAALALMDAHAALFERHWNARFTRLMLLRRARRWREVLRESKRELGLLESAEDLSEDARRRLRRLVLIVRANAAAQIQDYATALQAYAEAARLEATAGIYEDWLRAAIDAQAHAEVKRLLQEARSRFPSERVRWLFLEARWQEVRNARDQAETLYRQAIDQSPSDWDELVRFYLRTAQYAKAAEFLQKRMQETPTDVTLRFLWGATLERLGRWGEAEQVFQRILADHPDHAPTLNYLGYMWADRGIRLDDALRYIQRALRLDPENPAYLDSLAWVYYRQGAYAQAWSIIEDILKRAVTDPVILEHAGDICLALQDTERALVFWQRALDVARRMAQRPMDFDPDRVASKIRQLCPSCQLPGKP